MAIEALGATPGSSDRPSGAVGHRGGVLRTSIVTFGARNVERRRWWFTTLFPNNTGMAASPTLCHENARAGVPDARV
jgi:hypothetical protein